MSIAAEVPNGYALELSYEDSALADELHREFYSRLVRVCAGQLRDRSLAEDVAQETILRALKFWWSFDDQRPTWPWIKAIALRLCSDSRRARSREVCLDAMPEDALTQDETEDLVDELTLRRAMAALPERQRLALRLRYFDDRDRDDSAGVLGVNVNAFDQLLNRARLRLATAITPTGAGARLGLLWLPARWLRKRLSPRGRGLAASTALRAIATAPLAVTPLLAIIGGMAHINPSRPATPVQIPVSSQRFQAPATPAVAHRTAGVAAGHIKPAAATTVNAGPVTAQAWVSNAPLGHGQVENHGLRVVTPVTSVYVDGASFRSAEQGAACVVSSMPCPR